MKNTLIGNKIKSCDIQDSEKLQNIGFMNNNLDDYRRLVGCEVKEITHRGNTIRIQMNKKMNLVLCPDYGAKIHFHENSSTLPKKYHLKIEFWGGKFLTIRQTGMGLVYSATDKETAELYVVKRDFSDTPTPVGEHDFTYERFTKLLDAKKQNIKSSIVGKTAVVVGISNAAFQEIIYKAGIHPKRNTSTFTSDEKRALYDSIKEILNERICAGGKDNWLDLFGEQGRYTPLMGSNMKDESCPACDSKIEKISHGGGYVYYCPRCQK
jgi:formamidopyrimidine-DNA glycosylase